LTNESRTYTGEKAASSTDGAGKTGYLHEERLKQCPYLSPSTKINSKYIKDLNARFKSTKGKIWKTLKEKGPSDCFLNRTSIAQETRARIEKWYYVKFKSSCTSKK
jgi:hypothetical protein